MHWKGSKQDFEAAAIMLNMHTYIYIYIHTIYMFTQFHGKNCLTSDLPWILKVQEKGGSNGQRDGPDQLWSKRS
jgi:hypothetical protein